MMSGFPPCNYEDVLVEYLEVCAPEEQEQEQLQSKDLLDVSFKSDGSTCDSDSGRGSCDSHTLLTEKCGEAGEDRKEKDQRRAEAGLQAAAGWSGDALAGSRDSVISPAISSGRVKTWPSVFSSSPRSRPSDLLDREGSLVGARPRYPSDNLFPPAAAPSYISHPGQPAPLRPEFGKQARGLRPHTLARHQLLAHSDVDVSCVSADHAEGRRRTDGELLPQTDAQAGRCYSKVKGVDGGNVLLLQREEAQERSSQQREAGGAKGGCGTYSTVSLAKSPASAAAEEIILTTSGYVDTATVCMLPSC